MKILSWNVNGLRSVYRRGFLEWLAGSGAGIVCLQEIKAQREQLPFDLTQLSGYYTYFHSAQRLGYSGVAVYTREKPQLVEKELGLKRFDNEGRGLVLKLSDFTLINLYIPHGGRGKENLGYKFEVYNFLLDYLRRVGERSLVLAGDFNVAREEIDLARPKENQNSIMFTPEERAKLNQLLELGFTDSFRKFNQEGGNYTWWPYFAKARRRNLGWRIDYILTSKTLTPRLKSAFILSDISGSDHCPVGIEI